LSSCIALYTLHYIAQQDIDLENLAKGNENTLQAESYKDRQFTASSIKEIKKVLNEREIHPVICESKMKRLLWLGNSQLHYINQYKKGDHLSPYWLKMKWGTPDCIDPLGFSLPNADLQEFFVLSQIVLKHVSIDGLIVELVFDDLREDNLRNDFSHILTPETIAYISDSIEGGAEIMKKFYSVATVHNNDKDALIGTVQKPVESWLADNLNKTWGLWAKRPQIEGQVLLGLYNLRNYVFGIKPTSIRKMIKTRYDLNIAALNEMLVNFKEKNIPVLLYIAPIRQDKPIPYDLDEYARWKEQVRKIAEKHNSVFINLENLVPPELWGSYVGDEIDFMHFQGAGHKIVAEALLPHLRNIFKQK
jgi:hypothetical protein